jgi:hypothetical protein
MSYGRRATGRLERMRHWRSDRSHDLPSHPLSWRGWRVRWTLGMVAVVLLVRLIWGWQVGRVLRSQLDVAKARGEPVSIDEFRFEPVPDAENAWLLQLKAITAAGAVTGAWSPRQSNDDYRDYPPYPATWMTRAAASEQGHAQAFALARQARGLSRSQIRDRITSPVVNSVLVSPFNGTRNLANVLSDGAIYSHLQGHDAEAIERIFDVLHLARSLRQDPFAVSQLVALGVDSLALNTAQIIAPGLRFSGEAPLKPASRQQVQRLIDELLDEEEEWRAFARMFPGERLTMIDSLQVLSKGYQFIRPLADMEIIRENRHMEIAIEASHFRNKLAVQKVLARDHVDEPHISIIAGILGGSQKNPKIPRYSRWFSIPGGTWSRIFEVQFRSLSERRATAVSLAAQLFRADHGRWPLQLEELTPQYLPAVPSDPFHDDARALGYLILKGKLPGDADRPLVYIDAGPDDPAAIANEPMYGWQYLGTGAKRGTLRQYRDLSRFVPALPSTRAVNDDPDKSGGAGNQPEKNKGVK